MAEVKETVAEVDDDCEELQGGSDEELLEKYMIKTNFEMSKATKFMKKNMILWKKRNRIKNN